MANPIDLMSLADQLEDDAVLEIGGQKLSGADLKAWANGNRQAVAQYQTQLNTAQGELANLQKRFSTFQDSTGALMRAAATEAARELNNPTGNGNGNGNGAPAVQADPEWATYENDPLFSPFARTFERRVLNSIDSSYFKPWVEKELMPHLNDIRRRNQVLEGLLLDERQRREYRELGEWPENYDIEQARKVGMEREYYLPGTVQVDPNSGRRFGIVDVKRVHGDVMGPILQTKRDEEIKSQALEEATRRLRMEGVIIAPPNRTMTGAPPVRAKGSTAEEIFGNVMEEAGKDLETQRALMAISGR